MITLDRFGTPLEVGDIVTFSRQREGNYGTTFTVEWYEGIVHDIREHELNYHNYNRELVLKLNEYSEQAKARVRTEDNEHDKRCINDIEEELFNIQSNSVINKTKTIAQTKMAYPEFHI